MTSPVDRAHTELHAAERLDWVASLQPGSPVSVMNVIVRVTAELYVDHVENERVVLSNGHVFGEDGARSGDGISFLIQPTPEDKRAFLERKYRNTLSNFPWRELSAEQLEAVVKYAKSKLDGKPGGSDE